MRFTIACPKARSCFQSAFRKRVMKPRYLIRYMCPGTFPRPNDGFNIYEWASDPKGPWRFDNAYLDWLKERNPEMRKALRCARPFANPKTASDTYLIASYLTIWAMERTLQYLRSRRSPSEPLFCCMTVFDPHSPYPN